MQRFEVFDVDAGGALDFDLARVLISMPCEVREYKLWCLKEFEAVGSNILRVEADVQANPDGLCMGWDELILLSKGIEQIINLTLVGYRVPPDGPIKEALRIEVLDSSLWAVETDALPILEWIKTAFG